jgi:tetratricopeptide (TPR) repeat protein
MHRILGALQNLGGFRHRHQQKAALRAQVDQAVGLINAGDFVAALSLWEEVLKRWPDYPDGYRGVIQCARESGDFARAMAAFEAGIQRFPNDLYIIGETAITFDRQGNWKASVALWEKVVEGRKTPPIWLQIYAHDLLLLGRHDEVTSLLPHWRKRFPDFHGFLAVEGFLAQAREEWDKATAIWDDYRRRFPNEMAGWEHHGQTLQARQMARLDDHLIGGEDLPEPAVPEKIEVVEDPKARALLLGFESIGYDCEFGLVQRRFGAEPLGLLRFNAVEFPSLMAAIAERFDRMGEPDVTELITLHSGEYFVRDRRWGLGMHTFMFRGQTDADVVFTKTCRRIAFLRGKLLADLAEGRKIFVFLSPRLSLADLQMLHRELQSLGPVSLLNVRLVSTPIEGFGTGRAGEAIEIDRGLFVGYLGRSGRTRSGAWDIPFDDWLAVCQNVSNLVYAESG